MNKNAEEYKKRSIAAMSALAIGDAAGDLGRDNAVRQKYGILTRLLPEGKSTDDTEFTVLSARALLDNRENYTAGAVAETWRKLVLADGGVGARGGTPLYGAFWNLSQGIEPPLSGMDNTLNIDDGAAMRSIPFSIFSGGNPEEAARLAAIDASVSHDKDGIWAAQAVAAAGAAALRGDSVDEVITAGRSFIPQDSWLGRRMAQAFEILENIKQADEQYEALHSNLWAPRHSVAPEAIPQIFALYKMAEGDFRRGFILSANFGRDADTICALVLALCAAGKSFKDVPPQWIEQVRKPAGVCLKFTSHEDLVDLAEKLADAATGRSV